jgi:type 1 glutamine amidotransferase
MTRSYRLLAAVILVTAGVFILQGVASSAEPAPEAASFPRKKILFFSKSSAFEHGVIKQTNGQPSFVDRQLDLLGAKNNIEFVHSKDGSLFSPEYLAQFDAFMFYATGDLTKVGNDGNPAMTPAGKEALLAAIAGGKGFIGVHSAANAFNHYGEKDMGPNRYFQEGDKADPYILMLGGEFIKHDKEQDAPLVIGDAKFPGVSAIPPDFRLHEEWYTFKNFRSDLHVILAQDTSAIPQPSYQRPNYPMTWARMEGRGRVFYTSMGHRNDVWTNPVYQAILMGGIEWALGRVNADVTPNMGQVTPGANTLPEIYQKIGAKRGS